MAELVEFEVECDDFFCLLGSFADVVLSFGGSSGNSKSSENDCTSWCSAIPCSDRDFDIETGLGEMMLSSV